jgi:hypothetical protein
MIEYLMHVISPELLPDDYLWMHKHFDTDKFKLEQNLKEFWKYKGPLKKIVYIEERRISNETLIDNSILRHLDATFVVDFGDGPDIFIIENLKKWIAKNHIPDEKILIMSHSRNDINLVKTIIGKETKINFVIVQTPSHTAFEEFIGKKYKKRFLFLSRNWNVTRLISFVDLQRRGILENSYFSFFNVKNVYSSNSHEYYSYNEIDEYFNHGLEKIAIKNKSWSQDLKEYWNDEKEKIINGMPYLLENETTEISGRSGQQWLSNTLQDAFVNSAMSLVVETNNSEFETHFQCTEKTYKSMIYRHPFFVYGSKYQLQKTREYGFKTFSTVFDESYDLLNTPWERIFHIHEQVEILNKMPEIEFKKIIYKTIPETTFNFTFLMTKLSNFKVNVKYQRYDKDFDNLLKSNPPDYWYEDDY